MCFLILIPVVIHISNSLYLCQLTRTHVYTKQFVTANIFTLHKDLTGDQSEKFFTILNVYEIVRGFFVSHKNDR